jgi:virginiamycin A acetyltransferase
MDDANHALAGPSSFPFAIFGGAWAEALPIEEMPFGRRGDTAIGHDVWLGYESLVMPGVTIGDGAVVAARAVVTRDVPPYAIVAGNPARVVRRRYDEDDVERLRRLAWWDWPAARVTAAIPLLVAGDIDRLEAFAANASA